MRIKSKSLKIFGKKVISLILVVLILTSMLPVNTFADVETETTPRTEVSATLGKIPVLDGLTPIVAGDGGSHDPVVTTPGGIECWSMQPGTDRFYMYLDVDDTFIKGGINDVEIDVEYFDSGAGGMFTLLYDATDDATKQAEVVRFTNDNTWKTHTFIMNDARFDNRCVGQDMRIGAFVPGSGMSAADVNISKITVRKIARNANEVSATLKTGPNFDGLNAYVAGDGGIHASVVKYLGGKECWNMHPAADSFYMYLDVANSFIKGGSNCVEVDVEYYDSGADGGMFTLLYDATDNATKQAEVVNFTNDNTWKTHTFIMNDARFDNNCANVDMRIGAYVPGSGMSNADVNISKITVRKLERVSPVEADPQSGAIVSGTQVTLTTATTDANIYYTIDGNDPVASASKALYASPITIDKNTVIKAYATKSGMAASTVSTFKYYADAVDVTLNDFESKDDGWKVKTDITQSGDYGFETDETVFNTGNASGKLQGDFINSGENIVIEKELKLDDIITFSMFVKSTDVSNIRLRARDITGQYHEVPMAINSSGEWQQISLDSFVGGTHWGGANDGIWHTPITSVSIAVKKSDLAPDKTSFTIWLDDIKVKSSFVTRDSVSATLGAVPTFDGLYVQGGDNGAGIKRIEVNGKGCWQTSKADNSLFMYCNIDDGYILNEECDVQIAVEYLDSGNGKFTLQYDQGSGAEVVELKNSGEWKTYTFTLNNISLGNNINGADFRLGIWALWMGESTEDVCISKVTVKKMNAQAIKVQTLSDKVGNIYTESDALNMGISLTNTTPVEKNITVDYKVLNNNNYALSTGTVNLAIKPFATIIENPDLSTVNEFGTFNLEVNIHGDNGNINQQKVFPFSKVLASTTNQNDSIVGAVTHFAQGKGDIEKNLSIVAKAGIEWIRDEMYWGEAETTKGVFTFKPDWDNYINTAIAKGIQPLLVLGYGNSFYDNGKAPKSDEAIQGYANYVSKMAEHFNGRVKYFEIWNEWNGGLGNPDRLTPEDYAKLLIKASIAIKAVIPDAVIIGGATAGADITWLQRMIDAGAYDYIDAVSMHPYCYPASPEDGGFASNLNALKGIFGNKPAKEIWITEIGWPTHDVDKGGVTEMNAAAYAVRMYTWSMANKDKVDKVFWYDFQNDGVSSDLNESNFGLIKSWVSSEAIPWAAKENYVAISAMTNKLSGSEFVKSYNFADNVSAYQFHRASDNEDIMVLWTNKDAKNLGLNVGNSDVVLSDMLGNARNIKPIDGAINASVSQVPIYLEGTFGNNVTVVNPNFFLDAMAFNVVQGDILNININKTAEGMELAGEYQVFLPEGWTLTSSNQFSVGEALNTLTVTVPQNVNDGSYDISIYPMSQGNSLGAFKVTATIVKPYSIEVLPAAAKQGDWNKWKLNVTLKNNTSTLPVNGTVKVLEPTDWINLNTEKTFAIDAGKSQNIEFAVKDNPGQALYNLKMQVTLENGATEIIEKKISFLGALEADKSITADGIISNEEWAGAMPFNLNSNEQFIKIANETWTGIEDLSGTGYIKWDNDNIYLALNVVDDTHFQQGTGSDVWSGDGIQFTLDPGRRYGPGSYGYNEIGFAMNSQNNNTYNWRWTATGGKAIGLMDKAITVVKRDGNKTIYEAVIPWNDLVPNGIKIEAGADIGFSLLINDNDGTGRYGWLEYMSGVGATKDVNAFGDLVLVSKENNTTPPTPNPNPNPTPNPNQTPDSSIKVEAVEGEIVKVTFSSSAISNIAGDVKVAIDSSTYSKILSKINANKETATVLIEIPKITGAKNYAIELPTEVVSLSNINDCVIAMNTELGTVIVPQDMFDKEAVAGKKVVAFNISKADTSSIDRNILNQIGDRPVVEIDVAIDGKNIEWSNKDNSIEVGINYAPSEKELKKLEHITVWYINEKGQKICVPNAKYDSKLRQVVFTTPHLSKYAVAFVEKKFKDTPKIAWAEKQIEILASKGIIDIDGDYYKPQTNITRGEFIAMVVKALGLTATKGDDFSDVKAGDKYYNEISIAKMLGITSGTGNNKCNPDKAISRQDAFVITQKALSLSNKLNIKGDASTLNKFKDASIISNYAKAAIASLVKAEIVGGQPNNSMNPKGNISKAEASVLVYNCFNR